MSDISGSINCFADNMDDLDYYEIREILCNDNIEALKAIPNVGTRKLVNLENYSILHYAIEFESEECIKYLARTYPELLYTKSRADDIPLYVAIVCGIDIVDYYPDITKIIEEYQNKQYSTPIHMAAIYGAEEILKKLLSFSSKSIDKPGKFGKTALFRAIEELADWGILEALLEHGADPFYKGPSLVPNANLHHLIPNLGGYVNMSPYELAKMEYEQRCNDQDEDEYIETLRNFIEWVESERDYSVKEPDTA